ncbi:MAG: FeoB-associated Cys-rich membrane protein [Thermodesulfobacteriota bacterium]|nr:FeoB-associated Cys-rich membrane protein [Thermodesulfobacteriota bacterium]
MIKGEVIMDYLLIILIVALAILYIIKHLYRGVRSGDTCGCGCSSCNVAKTCEDTGDKKTIDS